jgi:hypothetical protein
LHSFFNGLYVIINKLDGHKKKTYLPITTSFGLADMIASVRLSTQAVGRESFNYIDDSLKELTLVRCVNSHWVSIITAGRRNEQAADKTSTTHWELVRTKNADDFEGWRERAEPGNMPRSEVGGVHEAGGIRESEEPVEAQSTD